MIPFKRYLTMAYNFVPNNKQSILDSSFSNKAEIAKLYDLIMKISSDMPDPIAVDSAMSKNVKIHRSLEAEIDAQKMKELAMTTGLKLAFGNGSRGNAGEGNRGIAFEKLLSKDLGHYVLTRDANADYKYKSFMTPFIKDVLSKGKEIQILDMGALNQKRPIGFSGSQPYIGSSSSVSDIGSTVTDITVRVDGKDHHLSLKMGGTVTFFNAGVTKIFPKSELEKGVVNNKQGRVLLQTLGIDPGTFARIFAEYGGATGKNAVKKNIDVTNYVDKARLKSFLATGVGYGYYLVHAQSLNKDSVTSHHMDRTGVLKAVNPSKVVVSYPTAGGAKRVDVLIDTPMFEFKVNIRNKQGGIFPSHVMCDYKIKH